MARPEGKPLDANLTARVAAGLRYILTGRRPEDWFGPDRPLPPMAPPAVMGRQFDYPVGYNLDTPPRAGERLTFHELRRLADSYDLLRLVIESRKDQFERLNWAIQPRLVAGSRPKAAGDPRIAAITRFFECPDGEHGWSSWLRILLEDLFVIDAPALYLRRRRDNSLVALEPVDGATIKRVLDDAGRTPLPPDPAYQQVLKGLPAVNYTRDELLYLPRNPRSHKVYGYSPVEQVVMTVTIALRRQLSQLQYYTEGNVPEALIGVPETWSPEQIRQFQEYWDALLSGNSATRRHARFVPGALAYHPTKSDPLKDDYDEWLARIVCYAFSVSPAPLVRLMNRATASSVQEVAKDEGLAPLQNWLKQFLDRLIAREFGAPDLEFSWRNEDPAEEDPATAAKIAETYVAAGIKSVDEVRAELGLDPLKPGQIPAPPVAPLHPSGAHPSGAGASFPSVA